jgi:hypothetical protein
MYGKPAMTYFKYQVSLYGSENITSLNASTMREVMHGMRCNDNDFDVMCEKPIHTRAWGNL